MKNEFREADRHAAIERARKLDELFDQIGIDPDVCFKINQLEEENESMFFFSMPVDFPEWVNIENFGLSLKEIKNLSKIPGSNLIFHDEEYFREVNNGLKHQNPSVQELTVVLIWTFRGLLKALDEGNQEMTFYCLYRAGTLKNGIELVRRFDLSVMASKKVKRKQPEATAAKKEKAKKRRENIIRRHKELTENNPDIDPMIKLMEEFSCKRDTIYRALKQKKD
jgi:hypothetical protein